MKTSDKHKLERLKVKRKIEDISAHTISQLKYWESQAKLGKAVGKQYLKELEKDAKRKRQAKGK